MSNLDKQAIDGYRSLYDQFDHACRELSISPLSPIQKDQVHPVIASYLWYEVKSREQNTSAPQTKVLLLDAIKNTNLKTNIDEIDSIIENAIANLNSEVVFLSPSDQLLSDFCHTRIPDAAKQAVQTFLSEKVVYIEFPNSARKKGIYLSGAYVDKTNGGVHCYSDGSGMDKLVEERIKDNALKFRDEIDALIDMIVLYYLTHVTHAALQSIEK